MSGAGWSLGELQAVVKNRWVPGVSFLNALSTSYPVEPLLVLVSDRGNNDL